MPAIIQLLPDHVANQIAAGEVVQRPASVVKELLENAVDAGADQIRLIVKDAGKTLIQVIDNGKGMETSDARLCFERHATSKIKEATDLFRLYTKGFRGEALASIAAIAHVELKTREADTELGTFVRMEGNTLVKEEQIATPKGTSIAVKNLFYNIPARRNFLKSTSVETRHIINEFQRIALAHQDIAFSCYHNDNELYNLAPGNLRQRIVAITGKKTNEKLVPIEEKTPIAEIRGFVYKSEFSRKKRGEQFFFVNNRFVKSAYLNHAVMSAYEGLIPSGFYPGYFLYLQLPTESIDINIHPTKTEIKFEDEKTLYAIIRSTVKHSLGQYNVAPVLDFNRDADLDVPYKYKDQQLREPTIRVNPDFNPFKKEAQKTPSSFGKGPTQHWESLYTQTDAVHAETNAQKTSEALFSDTATNAATFQIHRKYLISSIKSGIVYIHQHLAHQRILYEEYLKNSTIKEAVSQQLIFPLEMTFDSQDINLVKELKEDLEGIGFLFDKISDSAVFISGVPVNVDQEQVNDIFEQLLDDLKNDLPESSFSQIDGMAKSLAKSLAIKTGTPLTGKEQEAIVNKLFSCKQPELSPYGKKTFVTINLEDIDTLLKH
ncbi:MAG: DNA mismatch repair endonuclease MutL [Lutibacter sp.]|jgi:DNA mismatch repair protein MutL|nr:DNA mismatch repair endonuclease MutL [Lutibacter sp.]